MERFATNRVEVCPVQPVKPTKRVTQLGSLDADFLREQMQPNAIGGIENNGRYVDLREGAVTSETQPRQLTVVSMGSWGKRADLMVLDIGADKAPAFIDVPSTVLRTTMEHHALILGKFQNAGKRKDKVYYGENHSAGTLEGNGLQSVLRPHSHVFKFGEAQDDLTPEEIITTRNAQVWDEGVSLFLGQHVGGRVRREVLPQYRSGEVRADAMGFTINMPGFTTADIADPDFVRRFLRPLSLITHHALKDMHAAVFKSDLDVVIGYVQSRKNDGDVDLGHYKKFFDPASLSADAPPHVKKLHEFRGNGEVRESAGWALGIQISEEGGFAAVSFGTRKESLGPVEGFGVKLVRPSEPLTQDVMKQREALYYSIIDEQLKRAA